MAKATTYSFQGKEWTVKDLAEELGLSTHRVYRLLKDHNEDLKAIFESRGITINDEEKSAPVLLRIVLKDKPPNDGNKISDDVAADPVGLL